MNCVGLVLGEDVKVPNEQRHYATENPPLTGTDDVGLKPHVRQGSRSGLVGASRRTIHIVAANTDAGTVSPSRGSSRTPARPYADYG